MGNTVPVQSEKQQSPKQSGHLALEPAMSKGMPVQMRLSMSPDTEQCKSNASGPASPYVPSPVPPPTEDKTFMFATRQALENALGRETLEHLEALLQQEKKLTQDYIEQLEEAVKQNSGIGPQMQSKLVQKQVAHWKAKAEGHSENTKTEMKLLRDWNVRVKEEKDSLEAEVKQLRQENRMLRAETERLKGGQENENRDKEYEIKRLRMRNSQLEAEKDATNANLQMKSPAAMQAHLPPSAKTIRGILREGPERRNDASVPWSKRTGSCQPSSRSWNRNIALHMRRPSQLTKNAW